MEKQDFVISESEHLDRLIDSSASDERPVKTEEIKDEDILFFTEFGTLPPTDASQLLQQFDLGAQLNSPIGLPLPQASQFIQAGPTGLFVEEVKREPTAQHIMKFKNQDGKVVKIWECGMCGKEFGHQYTLMRHLPTHTDERKFHCTTCGKAFRQMSTLSQHRAIHSSDRPYVCEICRKTFNRVSTLISHRKTHTGLKSHRCHLCNKAFHQKGNLRNHIFTHTNERPYKCEICEKGFNQMSNLMCHKLKAHQRISDVPKYVCKICGRDFLKRTSLRNHEQFQHGLVSTPSAPEVKNDFANAILVEPIRTEAMRLAVEAEKTPFALLRPLSGVPVLVRVLPAGERQALVPATADDLKRYGDISVTPKAAGEERRAAAAEPAGDGSGKPLGSVVQIKVPVVATVIQQCGGGGRMSMSVVSPGPAGEVVAGGGAHADSFVYTSSLTMDAEPASPDVDAGNAGTMEIDAVNSIEKLIADNNPDIEFLDEDGKVITEADFHKSMNINPEDLIFDASQAVSTFTDTATSETTNLVYSSTNIQDQPGNKEIELSTQKTEYSQTESSDRNLMLQNSFMDDNIQFVML